MSTDAPPIAEATDRVLALVGERERALEAALEQLMDDFRGQISRHGVGYDLTAGWNMATRTPSSAPTPETRETDGWEPIRPGVEYDKYHADHRGVFGRMSDPRTPTTNEVTDE